LQHASGVFLCSEPGSAGLRERTIVRFLTRSSRETAACAAQVAAVAVASWSNCEQLFGFLTSAQAEGSDSDSGSGRASGRGWTCSVLGLAATNLQHNPEKNCEQFPKKKTKKSKKNAIVRIYR